MSNSILIKGVRLYGDGDQVDVPAITDGVIAEIGTGLVADLDLGRGDRCRQVLLPGLVDLHTHLREPGREHRDHIETGSAAAALGVHRGVRDGQHRSVADSTITDHVWRRGRDVGLVDVRTR